MKYRRFVRELAIVFIVSILLELFQYLHLSLLNTHPTIELTI